MNQVVKTPNSSTLPKSIAFGKTNAGPISKRQSFDKSTSINPNCGMKKATMHTTKNRSVGTSNFAVSMAESAGPTNIMIFNNKEDKFAPLQGEVSFSFEEQPPTIIENLPV